MIVRCAEEADFDAILRLQRENTPEHLSEAARRQGYIVSAMNRAQLQALGNALGIFVAVSAKRVAGFVCLSATDSRPRPPVVDALLLAARGKRLNGRPLDEQRLFLYGPVCVAAAFRGQGIARALLDAVKRSMREQADAGLAFIADDNPHSLAVHVDGLGMCDLATFRSGEKTYHLIAFAV